MIGSSRAGSSQPSPIPSGSALTAIILLRDGRLHPFPHVLVDQPLDRQSRSTLDPDHPVVEHSAMDVACQIVIGAVTPNQWWLPSSSRFSLGVGGSDPMKVARTISATIGSVMVPVGRPLIVNLTLVDVKSSIERSPSRMDGTAARKRCTWPGSRWQGALQFFSKPSNQACRASSAVTA